MLFFKDPLKSDKASSEFSEKDLILSNDDLSQILVYL